MSNRYVARTAVSGLVVVLDTISNTQFVTTPLRSTADQIARALNLLDEIENSTRPTVTLPEQRRQERMHLAGLALAVIVQYPTVRSGDISDEEIADCAVRIADALIDRLNKE